MCAKVATAHEQTAALPLPAAPVAQEPQPEGFLVDVAEDMVSEQHTWLANLVNFFAQFQGLDAACQACSLASSSSSFTTGHTVAFLYASPIVTARQLCTVPFTYRCALAMAMESA